MSNYRLVALLPVLSKVLESIMVQQLYQHFEQELPTIGNRSRRLLTERQHGYRKKMSCQSNIIQMIDDILQDCQNGDETALCMADLSAAFDTVKHDIFIEKLKLYGLSPETILWFRSYLEGRSQFVDVDGERSEEIEITVGVFQGSVAGPLLFLIYFNDLICLQDQNCHVVIYADDNNYAVKLGQDVEENRQRINLKLKQVEDYMNANKLKFNVEKTQLMIMSPKRVRINEGLEVEFNGHTLKPDKHAKFLGITISDDLSWYEYILNGENGQEPLLSYLNKKLGALKKMSKFCNIDQMLL